MNPVFPSHERHCDSSNRGGKESCWGTSPIRVTVLRRSLCWIEQRKAFLWGDHSGLLGIAFGCNLGWIENATITSGVKLIDQATTPQLTNWAKRFLQEPAVSAVMPDKDKLLEFSKVLYPKHTARLIAQSQLPKYFFEAYRP